jgi:t-SNARE complex subunit (syntaxin)
MVPGTTGLHKSEDAGMADLSQQAVANCVRLKFILQFENTVTFQRAYHAEPESSMRTQRGQNKPGWS